MTKIKHCKKCLMPNTRPGSIFDEEGICQACLNYKKRKEINWDERREQLRELCRKYRRNDNYYDCLIPVSGGKDSYLLTYMMKEELGMHPLLITVTDSFAHTKAGSHNLRNLIETFKVNHYQYTINHDLFRRATRVAFEETGEALKFVECAIYTIPALFAQKFDIPFVIFGENGAYEYGTTAEESYLATSYIQAMSNRLEKEKKWWVEKGLTEKEVDSIQIDKTKPLPETIYMSYFEPWSSTKHLEIAKRYGFVDLAHEWKREGCIEDFEQIDSVAYMTHLWLKYPKFGFQRTSDIASRRVREGLLSLSEAKKLIIERDHKLDQRAMEDLIKFCGYTPKQFWDIVDKFWNPDLFEKVDGVWERKFNYDE